MKKTIKFIPFLIMLFVISIIVSCNKNKEYPLIAPPIQASFSGLSTASFGISNTVPLPTYKLPIGLTTTSSQDTKVTISVTSPTGAVEGTQYKIPNKTLTIPAGQALGFLDITSTYDAYKNDRIDTLNITLTADNGVAKSDKNSTIKLVLNKFCPFNADALIGDFIVVKDEWQDYAPGSTIVVTKVNATQVSFKYKANAAQPIIISVDAKNITSVAKQVYGNYADQYGNYSVNSVASSDNYTAPCEGLISVRLKHTVSAGSFGDYTITLRKK